MPLDRLDPKTGQEIDLYTTARWSVEEIEAYLDYNKQLDEDYIEQEKRRLGLEYLDV